MADAVDPNVAAQRNRMPGGAQNNLINVRERLFHAIYFKVALMYAQVFPPWMRRTLEYIVLFKAIAFFGALVYLHVAFIKNPATCLQHVKDWPRDGVLRVEVIPYLSEQKAILRRTRSYEQLLSDLRQFYHYGIGPQTHDNHLRWRRYEDILKETGYHLKTSYIAPNETITYLSKTDMSVANDLPTSATSLKLPPLQTFAETPVESHDDEQCIVEYALEYGHLRLSSATRKRLRIPVRVVQLDPMKDKCFGDDFSKFMLKNMLGYDDLLMASVRVIAEQENNQGYLRNVITGEHYRFVSMWWAAWSSYPTAFAVMLLFTFSISMLLRFSHHQIFVFIVDLLQMLEFNVTARFPVAPLLTVILALVGMEAIMSEFFNDTTTAFYIILIVWIADQYDAICCHTTITKRHWLRFFYLYHFAFYAYHYRFSGQNRNLSLITSLLFIQHSMLFFFHRYELPVIAQQPPIIILTRNQANGAAVAGGGVGGGGAGGAGGENDIAGGAAENGGNGAPADAAVGQQQQQQQQQPPVERVFIYQGQPAGALLPGQLGFRISLLNILPIRNRQLRWDTIQRALMQRGWLVWRGHAPNVRIQMGNAHHRVIGEPLTATLRPNLPTAAGAHDGADDNVAANNTTTATTSAQSPNNSNPHATSSVNATSAALSGVNSVTLAATLSASEAQAASSNVADNEEAATASNNAAAPLNPQPAATDNQEQEPQLDVLSQSEQREKERNNKTGNNNVKQPETDERQNKIESQAAAAITATTTTTISPQTNHKHWTELTASSAQTQIVDKGLVAANQQLKLAADESHGVGVEAEAVTTKSDQTLKTTPQYDGKGTVPTLTMPATGDEPAMKVNLRETASELKATDITQPSNGAKIENADHSNAAAVPVLLSLQANGSDIAGTRIDSRTSVGATKTFPANEKFDMIDNAQGGQQHSNADENNTPIATTTLATSTSSATLDATNPRKHFNSSQDNPKDSSKIEVLKNFLTTETAHSEQQQTASAAATATAPSLSSSASNFAHSSEF